MDASLRATSVLLIEDDDDAAFLYQLVLERAGATVLRAAGVADALRLSRLEEPIDLVISDVHLPDGSGADVLDGWPPERPRPAALALTGDTSASTRAQLEAAGFGAVMSKPAAVEEVIRRGAELVARRAPDRA